LKGQTVKVAEADEQVESLETRLLLGHSNLAEAETSQDIAQLSAVFAHQCLFESILRLVNPPKSSFLNGFVRLSHTWTKSQRLEQLDQYICLYTS
jgi:hypothetical protein